jgi:hypothetical protein
VKIKSNDRMPAPTQRNIAHFTDAIATLPGAQRIHAEHFAKEVGARGVFEILHSMRRWYSGQTMARKLLAHYDALREVMDIEPCHAVGVYRGFKVPIDNPLAKLEVGQELALPVRLNHGFSSWSTTEGPTHLFSGGGKGKVGLIVQLVDDHGITPVLAPPNRTRPWFNALYAKAIGTSFRPKEGEYLIAARKVRVRVVRVKRR